MLRAVLTNALGAITNQAVTFTLDLNGDGTNESFTAHTDGNGLATQAVTSSRAAGQVIPYQAAWDGVVLAATDTAAATISDPVPPEIWCPGTVLVYANPGECDVAAAGVALGSPTATDGSGSVAVSSNAPAVYAMGTSTVMWVATDPSLNSATCAQQVVVGRADPNSDYDGDRLTDSQECRLGSDPKDPASGLAILGLDVSTNGVRIVWRTVGGTTNIAQASDGLAPENFNDLGPGLVVPGLGTIVTNYVEPGGQSNGPVRVYRVRVPLGP